MTHSEYMSFFERWLHYQFPSIDDDWDNILILKAAAKIVADPDDLSHWAGRDCWSMYDLAKSTVKESIHG